MPEKTYKDPELALNRIYTRSGDQGETRLVNGRRIPKDDLKIEAYGTVDELNSFVGMACFSAREMATNVAGGEGRSPHQEERDVRTDRRSDRV